MTVSFTGDQLQVSATLGDAEAVDTLIMALTANKTLLPKKKVDKAPEDRGAEEMARTYPPDDNANQPRR